MDDENATYDLEEFVEEPCEEIDQGPFEIANGEMAGLEQLEDEQKLKLTVVESPRVDLDAIMHEYTDYALINRLLFISDLCPPLKIDALRMLANYLIKNTQNVSMLNTVYQKLEAIKNDPAYVDEIRKIPEMDKSWIDQTSLKAASRLDSYQAEYKRQKDEAVKESIRRSIDDLFHQHVQMGNLQEALKLYGRGMREYCTAPNYVIQMLLNWINVTIYADQWSKLTMLLPQAERAISEIVEREALATSTATTVNNYGSSASSNPRASAVKNYRELVQSSKAKITAVFGLSKMYDKMFKQAAEKFITVDADYFHYPHLLTISDVATYGTLCSMATFNRTELKERVLTSPVFRKCLESEPRLIELLQKFCHSQFGECMDMLNEMRDQFHLNIFLAPHVNQLYFDIRQSAVVQYFQPYMTANINKMALEFRKQPEEMENELITLIESGLLKARIDSYNKIIHAKFSDNRSDIYRRILSLQKEYKHRMESILLRASLHNYLQPESKKPSLE